MKTILFFAAILAGSASAAMELPPNPCEVNRHLPQCRTFEGQPAEKRPPQGHSEVLRDGKQHIVIELTHSEMDSLRGFNVCSLEGALMLPQCLAVNGEGSTVLRLRH